MTLSWVVRCFDICVDRWKAGLTAAAWHGLWQPKSFSRTRGVLLKKSGSCKSGRVAFSLSNMCICMCVSALCITAKLRTKSRAKKLKRQQQLLAKRSRWLQVELIARYFGTTALLYNTNKMNPLPFSYHNEIILAICETALVSLNYSLWCLKTQLIYIFFKRYVIINKQQFLQ